MNYFNGLPTFCYYKTYGKGGDNIVVKVKRYEMGYQRTQFLPETDVDVLNSFLGVTAEEKLAMTFGSMFGWNSQGCNPDTYASKKKPTSVSGADELKEPEQ